MRVERSRNTVHLEYRPAAGFEQINEPAKGALLAVEVSQHLHRGQRENPGSDWKWRTSMSNVVPCSARPGAKSGEMGDKSLSAPLILLATAGCS